VRKKKKGVTIRIEKKNGNSYGKKYALQVSRREKSLEKKKEKEEDEDSIHRKGFKKKERECEMC